jgi:hypothetical protein
MGLQIGNSIKETAGVELRPSIDIYCVANGFWIDTLAPAKLPRNRQDN